MDLLLIGKIFLTNENNVTDGLNKVFEVGTDLVEVDKEKKQADVPQDVDNDYKYARENLYGVIEKEY